MIHEDLIRHFSALPEPQLTAEFSAHLRDRLEASQRPDRRFLGTLNRTIRRWGPRVYWIAATALVLRMIRPPMFAPEHVVAMVIVASITGLAIQRALRPTSLTRILREALLR